jgi:predicted O-methyltransferase YrrM
MPPRLAARIDFLVPGFRTPEAGDAPLNGQVRRQQAIRQLVAAIPFDEVVETGTFRGASTEFFAALTGLPVYSAEGNPRFFEFARRRLAGWPSVHVDLADSRTMLRRLSQRVDIDEKTALFYLDAHNWDKDLPLREEVTIVARGWRRAVVVIDDFRVPDDPGYAFDDYGPGKRLDASYLPMEDLAGWELLYPAAPAMTETGRRRGSVVLVCSELVKAVSGIPELRRSKRNP